jgi:hypothetical protein
MRAATSTVDNEPCEIKSPPSVAGSLRWRVAVPIPRRALDGKVLGVIGKSGRGLKEFSGAHAIACPSENLIDAAETANWRVQKLILH